MKSFTHYPVAAPQSLFVSASLHRPNYLAGQPVIFLFALMAGLMLLAGKVQAQPFNQTGTPTVVNPLGTMPNNQPFTAGTRSVPVFVDIDNDCDKDCFVGNGSGNVLYYKNMGSSSTPAFVRQLGAANPLNLCSVGSNAKPVFVDIDADGDMDCFVGAGDGTVHAFKNIGTAINPIFDEMFGQNSVGFDGNPFAAINTGAVSMMSPNASPGFLDLDNDGDFDCFVARSNNTGSIRYFRNEKDKKSPFFVEMTGVDNPLSNIAPPMGVGVNGNISNAVLTFANLSGDANPDCYVGMADGKFRYYENNGDGTFTFVAIGSGPLDTPALKDVGTASPLQADPNYSAPAFVDIDGDGDLDCFSGREDGIFIFYRNDVMPTARTISCKPYYFVTLNPTGQATVVEGTVGTSSSVTLNDVLLGTTFTCLNELTFTVKSSRAPANFTCADATNTAADPTGTMMTTTPGNPTLTITATDLAGNTAICSLPVKVLDKTPPVPNTPTLAPINIDVCAVSTFPSSYIPTATDVCPVTAVSGVASPLTLPASKGVRIVTWTYTDSHGNTSTQTQTFNVVSTVPPSFTNPSAPCPASPINLVANPSTCGFQGTAFNIPSAIDCGPITYTSNYTPGSFFPVGSNNVTYAATDTSGNTGYCNFTVMVTESTPPTVTLTSPACPTSVTLSSTQGACGAVHTWVTPGYTVTDNCAGTIQVGPTSTSGSTFPIGTTPVMYKATDVSGNMTTFCPFTVTVTDNQSPSITCPVSATINTAPGTCTANVNVVRPIAMDNCSATVVETNASFVPISTTLPRTQTLSPGQTTLYFRANDNATPTSNTVTCSYTITVVDTEKPKFTGCPANVTMQTAVATDCSKSISWITPTVTDNCTGFPPATTYAAVITGKTSGTVTSTAGTTNSFAFNEGNSTVTYTVSDGATPANTEVCSFTVRITNTVAPTITCPASPVIVSPGANCLYTLTRNNSITNTTIAPCDTGVVTYYSGTTLLTIGTSTFGLGTSTLTARATDASNNTSTCTFNLQVIDQTAPTLVSCPPNITVNSTAALCGANPTWVAPVYSDNCSPSIVVTKTTTPSGSTPNTAVVLANNSGGFFPVGTTTVNFTAKDSPASTYINVSCSIVVKVVDNVPPQFTNCPTSPVLIPTSAVNCSTTHSLLTPVVTDNCPTASTAMPAYTVTYTLTYGITTPPAPFTSIPFTVYWGDYTVVYTAVDNASPSNSATCTYILRVQDRTAPVITCPANQNIVATSGCSATAAAWPDPVAVDNCSGVAGSTGPTIISSPSPVTISGTSTSRSGTFPAGSTVIGYTATDYYSNVASCSFTIFVKENVAPIITCPSNITVSTDAGSCTRTLTPSILGVGATATDNCQPQPLVTNTLPQSPNVSPVISNGGTYTVTYTATDASGNTAACTQTITVMDQMKPLVVCPAPFTYIIPVGNGNSCVENGNNGTIDPGFAAALPKPTATDNCTPTASLIIIHSPGQPGQYCTNTTNTLQWQTTDLAGNIGTCTQQIIIQTPGCTATTPQIIGCTAAPVTLQDAPGCPATVTVTPATFGLTATDNCGTTITITPSTAVLNATGTAQNVTFTAAVGQTVTTCVKSVIVTPAVEICGNGIDDDCNPATSDVCPSTPAPTFTNCPTTPSVLPVNAANCSAIGTFPTPTTNPVGLTVNTTGASSPFTGTSTITYTASNANGTATCVRTVIVNPAVEVCGNGIDDDCDGLIDAADSDCGGTPGACAVVKRQATDGLANDLYGTSVDVDDNIAVVGSYYDDPTGMNSGSVYVLSRGAGNTWQQVAQLIPTDGTSSTGDWFGRSVAIDGDYIVVGAPQEAGSGAVYVFHKGASVSSWTQVARLVDPSGVSGDQLGYAVAISGDYIIAGAPNDEPIGSLAAQNDGSVSIYQRNTVTGVWSLVVKRVASDAMPGDLYGSSVSIDGDYAAVGAPMDDYPGNKTNAGSVYVLRRNVSNTWTEIAHQHASDYLKDDNYGTSVGISGSNLLVGSPLNDVSAKQNAGSVYVLFQDEGGADAWGETENLIADDFAAADQFGISVSVDGDVAAIGAHFDDVHGFHSGSTYLFDGSGGWLQIGKLDDATGDMNDNFGYSVGLSGTTVIVGSWKDDILGVADQGSVSIFDDCSTLFRPEVENRDEALTPSPAKVGKVLCAPNPATDIINIDVTLAQEEAVRITVIDATGRIVETIFDGKAAAESRFQWDGGRYGRGMYFIRVQSASVSKVVGVTLLR